MNQDKKPIPIPEVKVKEVKLKFIPFKCVVCNGWGTVSSQRVVCKTCSGKGYIEVPAEEVSYGK